MELISTFLSSPRGPQRITVLTNVPVTYTITDVEWAFPQFYNMGSFKKGTIPRVASLQNSATSQHLCGATIVSQNLAITAAHCVHRSADQYQLQLNNYCGDEGPPRVQVLEVIAHELYDKRSRAHDIALLRIWVELGDTWLNDTVLPISSFGLSGDCTIYGYGTTHPDITEYSENLRAANVKIVSLDECTDVLGPIAPEYNSGMICATGNGTDSCQGDSGGPLMCGTNIEGVSSYGQSCGVPGIPGVYTSTGAHLRWIHESMRTTGLYL